MSEDSRRTFLKWLAAAPALAVGSSCSTSGDTSSNGESALDSGPPADGSRPDTAGYPSGGDGDASETGRSDSGGSCEATGSDVEGPFHAEGAPERAELAPDDEPGTPLVVEGTVLGPDCRAPIAGAMLDVWHADAEGEYYDADETYRLRGQVKADDGGSYRIRTIRPGNYPLAGSLRPAHVHFNVAAPGFEPLTTQLYFSDDPHLAPNDPCGPCSSGDPSQIVDVSTERRRGTELQVATFDIVLREA